MQVIWLAIFKKVKSIFAHLSKGIFLLKNFFHQISPTQNWSDINSATMKFQLSFALFLFFFASILIGQPSQNMTLLGSWDDNSLPPDSFGDQYSDCWGYSDASGEYAIMGSATFIHIFNVTNPANPIEILRFPGGTNTGWREFRTYSHYLYCVTDQTNEGLRIFDLANLPAAPVQVYNSTAFFSRCHTIHVDAVAGRLYCAGTNTRNNGLIVLNIAANPASPTLLASVALPPGNYVHDCFVKDNKVYASHGNNGLMVWNFTNPAAPVALGSLNPYLEQGYNHSSWMNTAGTHLVMTDETHATGVKMVRITDLQDIIVTDTFRSALLAPNFTNSIAHNPCVKGDFVYLSYYHDGIQVWDISNPSNVERVGYYDTEPANTNYNSYAGPWGVFPYLPSGTIVGSDLKNGLKLLSLNSNCRTPTTLAISGITYNSALADWNDIPSSTQYRVRYRAVGAASWTVVTTANATTSAQNLANLAAATTYQVQVASNCPYGWTKYAAIKTFTTPSAPGCQPPATTSVTNLLPTSARINCSAVSGATGYRISYRKLGTTAWNKKVVTTLFRNCTGLQAGKTYQYQVETRCSATVFSAPTAIQTFTTPTSLPPVIFVENEKSIFSENEFSIFPNPTNDQLNIQFLTNEAIEDLTVEIFDETGKKVISENFNEENHLIFNLENLPAGNYVCRVKTGEVVENRRFVKI